MELRLIRTRTWPRFLGHLTLTSDVLQNTAVFALPRQECKHFLAVLVSGCKSGHYNQTPSPTQTGKMASLKQRWNALHTPTTQIYLRGVG